MEKKIILRPKGKMYIIAAIIIYVLLLGLISFNVVFILEKEYVGLLFNILPIFCLIVVTRMVVTYKICLTDTEIHIPSYTSVFDSFKKDIIVSYNGLRKIQYSFGLKLSGFFSTITLMFDDDRQKHLEVIHFSDRQVDIIIENIKYLAEKFNSQKIEVLSDNIQKGFKRERRVKK